MKVKVKAGRGAMMTLKATTLCCIERSVSDTKTNESENDKDEECHLK